MLYNYMPLCYSYVKMLPKKHPSLVMALICAMPLYMILNPHVLKTEPLSCQDSGVWEFWELKRLPKRRVLGSGVCGLGFRVRGCREALKRTGARQDQHHVPQKSTPNPEAQVHDQREAGKKTL